MSSFLYRLGRFAARRRLSVIGVWLVLAFGAGSLAAALGNHLQSTFEIPGTQAQTALDALEQRFPQISGASAKIVIAAPAGSSIAASENLIVSTCQALASISDIEAVSCPYDVPASGSAPASAGQASQISAGGDMVFVSLQLSIPATEITDQLVQAVDAASAPLTQAGLQVAPSGLVAAPASGIDWTELAGMAVAFVVLAFTFASLLAAGIPLITAALGVGVATSAITIVAAVAPVSSTAPVLATMLGLAVGIDYALLITSRHRDNLRVGMPPQEAAAVAIATAGTAVVFAGMTVMIALLGLAVAGIPFLTVMGLGAAAAVLSALAVAVTLLPAVLSLLGHRLKPREQRERSARRSRRPLRRPRAAATADRTRGWIGAITRHPVLSSLGVAVVLLTVAFPATALRLTLPDAGYDPPGSPARVAYDLLDAGFGPGFNGPLLITADISRTLDVPQALDALDGAFSGVPGVAAVSQAFPNEALDMAVVTLTPDSAPSSDATAQLVQTLRAGAAAFEQQHGFTYQVTGQTALAIDISDRLAQAMLPFALVVVGLSLLLLTIMFRSLAVPLTATLGYLLTVGAALGIAAAVFEWGWAAAVFGVGKVGPVISFMPILVMAVLFGLAMDYHVFLVSRMRERYVATADAHASVISGFSASARVVTAAALIMFSVFFSFVPGGSAVIQPIAFALAVGVLIDAFVVRMTLVPALMTLLGERAWWLPRWLERILPDADIEGEAVHHVLEQRTWFDADASHRATGIHAESASVDSSALVDFSVPAGGVLLVRGAHAAGLCAVLTGRSPAVTGNVVAAGLLLPFQREPLSRISAFVPARAEGADAETLREYLRVQLRNSGVRRRDLSDRMTRAARYWDELRGVGRVLDNPEVARELLTDRERWAVEAAVALSCGAVIVAADLRGHPDQGPLVAAVLRCADPATTLVLATDAEAITDRTCVAVTLDVEEARV